MNAFPSQRRVFFCLLGMSLLGSGVAEAQKRDELSVSSAEREDERRRQTSLILRDQLTLARTMKLAEERSPRVQSVIAALEAAGTFRAFGKVPVVRNPYINLRAMVGFPDDPAATYEVNAGIPFDVGGQRRYWRKEAEALISQLEAQLEVARNDARSQARVAFVSAGLGALAVQVEGQRVELANGLLQRVRARMEAKAATALDIALAEREVAQAQASLLAARRVYERAKVDLREALDLPPLSELDIASLELPRLPTNLTAERAARMARDRRFESEALERAAQRFERSERRLRAQAIEPFFLGPSYELQGNTARLSSVGVNASFTLPFVFTNQAERAVARGEAKRARIESSIVRRTVEREASGAFLSLEFLLQELERIEREALPLSQRIVEMRETQLVSGAADIFLVLLAQRDLYGVRAQRVEALRQAWYARIALERAVGASLP